MRTRLRPLLPILAAAVLLPLATDAGMAVPTASKEAACVKADEPFTRIDGDEKFFDTGTGVPNVMILLDDSGSMTDFPTDIPYPSSWPGTNGTCTTAWDSWSATISSTATTLPYDNGFSGLVSDAPTWAYGQCTGVANPAGDNVADNCLFRGGGAGGYAYYKYYGAAAGMGGQWSPSNAQVYNANPCSVVDTNGNVQHTGLGAVINAPNLAECRTCLATKGYYLFRQNSSSQPQAVFRGDFLNANPPKFIIARKVVKDIARIDSTNPNKLDSVRLGLTVFTAGTNSGTSNGLKATDGGILVVPLGPNCNDSWPPTQAAYATPRQVLVNAVNNPAIVTFSTSTPLAETLFNIGQYFADSSYYTTFFGSSWNRNSFANTAAGSINAAWATNGGKQDSFCWWCQQSSVVIVTDGEPTNDDNLPTYPTPGSNHSTFSNDFRKWSNSTIDCPTTSCNSHLLHKVAYFMNQTDLRRDLAGGRNQTVSTYTISFGLNSSTDAAAIALLQKTADLGGGAFKNTSSGAELASALNSAVGDVVDRSEGFSAANANALQTSRTNQADAYVARFKPNGTKAWEGHVFGAMLFDEFGQGCDSNFPTGGQKLISCGTKSNVNPNLNGDSDGGTPAHALCTGAWLVDRDCDPIVEDANGSYKKGVFDAGGLGSLTATADDAEMYWDAGKVLSDPGQPGYKSAKEGQTSSRKIYTTIDANSDGKLTAADGLVEFTADNAAALAPSMSLDADSCIQVMTDAYICGAAPLPACPTAATFTAANRVTCAQLVINYVRGWDVMDEDKDMCAGPGAYYNTNPWGSCTTADSCGAAAKAKGVSCVSSKCVYQAGVCNGEERDRTADHRVPAAQTMWKLGDVFHSSPVLVRRPIDKLTCWFGLSTQCARTIYSPQELEGVPTPQDGYGTLDAYDAWRQMQANRDQFILVGANDGMLHAFQAGSVTGTAGADGFRNYDNGTGSEMWAYIPPDLLPKLKKSLYTHNYYVDGTAMVRDVWYDSNHDGYKQRTEFHTVAVIAERAGGNRWTALDVTDPYSPQLLWTFPDACTQDSVLAGESWSEFLPRPPPIGPVRLRATGSDPKGRGYDERWVVMLSGGFDPTYVRGRGVWMLDVWTGAKLWQYFDADFKAMRGDAKASMFPVAATVGMSDVGRLDAVVGNPQTDGMFDTATWGDTGGQMWVARFYEVGSPATGPTNWTAARTFEQARRTDDQQYAAGRTSYFYMTVNVPDHPRGLRVLVGSGNRSRLMDETPTCGPDDMFGCARGGCSAVSATGNASYGAGSCSASGTFTATAAGLLSYTGASANCAGSFNAPGPVGRQTTVAATCSSPATYTATRSCDTAGLCGPGPTYKDISFASSQNAPASISAPATWVSRFVSFWGYGIEPNKRFTTAAEAKVFDANRFTDVAYAGCANWPATTGCQLVEVANAQVQLDARGNFTPVCQGGATKCKAEKTDPGWMFTYGKWCPNGAGNCSSSPPWYDEATGSQAGGAFNCVIWSGFRPTGAVTNGAACTSALATATAYTYFADYFTGLPTIDSAAGRVCGVVNDPNNVTQVYRSAAKNAFSAPQSAQLRVSINDKGQVGYSALSIDSGSNPTKFQLGTRSSALEPLYWLEVPREVHTCRHVDGSTCK